MRDFFAFITFTFLLLPLTTVAIEKGGITMPDQLQSENQSLTLNGAGIRNKFIFDIYVAGLYLPEKNSNASTIISSHSPMAIRLHIISSKITSKKFSKATRQGFEKSTNNNTKHISTQIDQFIDIFSEPIMKGDIIEFINVYEKGVIVTINGIEKAVIPSDEFKSALFGIWLSDNPIQVQLKEAMLGK